LVCELAFLGGHRVLQVGDRGLAVRGKGRHEGHHGQDDDQKSRRGQVQAVIAQRPQRWGDKFFLLGRRVALGGRGTNGGVVVPTVAFYERYRDEIGTFAGSLLRVRTAGGARDVARVARTAKQMFGRNEVFSVQRLSIEGEGAQDAIDVTTVGLFVAAAVAGVTGLVGAGIALSREVALVDADQPTLRALGVRPQARVLAAAAVGLPVAVAGAVLAFGGALVASRWFPIGVAGEAG